MDQLWNFVIALLAEINQLNSNICKEIGRCRDSPLVIDYSKVGPLTHQSLYSQKKIMSII